MKQALSLLRLIVFVMMGMVVNTAFSSMTTAQITPTDGIVYVTPDGGGNGSGWGSPTSDLQGAINAAGAPGTLKVFVAIGNYNAPANGFKMKANVAIYGGFNPLNGITNLTHNRILPNRGPNEGSVLNGQNTGRVIWNNYTLGSPLANHPPAILDGFTIKNGVNNAEGGGGIYNFYASATFSNLVIKENKAEYQGAGVLNENCTPVFTNVIIRNNELSILPGTCRGGGMANLNASPKLVNVAITGNKGSSAGNSISYGAGMYNNHSYPVLINVTIADNLQATSGGGMYNANISWPEIYNSIIWGNQQNGSTNASGADIEGNNSAITLKNSITQGFSTGNGGDNNRENTDPRFAPGGYTLLPASPAINKGNNSFYDGLDETTRDLLGNDRVYRFFGGGDIDMGAYEAQNSVPIVHNGGTVYVKPKATGKQDGSSWNDATADFQAAIDGADVQRVFVATGNYNIPTSDGFKMKNGVRVFGGFDPGAGIIDLSFDRILPTQNPAEGSVLNGRNAGKVINNDYTSGNPLGSTAILDGFTIMNGNSIDHSGGIYNGYASPVFQHIVVRNNTAVFYGGGVYNFNANPVFTNSIIRNNTLSGGDGFGGGVCNWRSSPEFTNVCITDNTANATGGGVYNDGDIGTPVFTNVTIAHNSLTGAIAYGAGMYNSGDIQPEVYNTIIWGNGGMNGNLVHGSDIYNNGQATLILKNSTTQGYSTGDHLKVNQNPQFVNAAAGDYRLQRASPAIDAGDKDYYGPLSPTTKDLAGNLRWTGNAIDMGAYENPDGALPVRWISFEGRLTEQRQAVLTWKTEETNVSHYEVERSADARTFRIVDTVIAGSSGSGNYSLTDPVPVSGKMYYRIRQVDTDGAFSHSRIISLASSGSDNLFAYPNPLRERATVELDDTYIGSTVSLINTAGIILEQLEVKQTTLKLDMQKYAPGIYLLRTSDGKVIKLLKE